MDIEELSKKKAWLEFSILKDIQNNIRLFELTTGVKVLDVELCKIDVAEIGDPKPFYVLSHVEATLNI